MLSHVPKLAGVILLALVMSACSSGVVTTELTVANESGDLLAAGFLEADEVSVVSEVSGRVAEVVVDRADPVSSGDVLVVLDDALLRAERMQAEAAISVAGANLERMQAGATGEELAAAQAALAEAEASVDAARLQSGQLWANANNPTQYDPQIAAARSQADLAARRIELLKTQRAELEFRISVIRDGDVVDGGAIHWLELDIQATDAQIRAAQAELDGANARLTALEAQRDRPLSLITAAQQASAQIPVAEAGVAAAQAQLDRVVNGATIEEIAIAEAQLRLAEAQLALLDARLNQLEIAAPMDGIVISRAVEPGETASAGRTLITIANQSTLSLIVYIAQPELGRVRVGEPIDLYVDAFPGEDFEGTVVRIGDQAEFTPDNVQTEEDRVDLVFAVEIQITNEDGLLRPGMAVDAVFPPAE